MSTQALKGELGTESEASVREVEASAILRFTDAIGDMNPVFRDRTAARMYGYDEVIAPPTFLRALSTGLSPASFPNSYTEMLDGGSTWEYLRPVLAGDRISITSKLVGAKEREGRLGPMLITLTNLLYVNSDGANVATQRTSMIYYNPMPQNAVTPKPDGTSLHYPDKIPATSIRRLSWDDIQEGQLIPTVHKRPTTRQLVMYAGASGDYYEIHYDHVFAQSKGLSRVIVHGALKNAFLGQMLTDWAGPNSIRKLDVRYNGMDEPGMPLLCKGKVTDTSRDAGDLLVHCDIWVENGDGEKTTTGSAVVTPS